VHIFRLTFQLQNTLLTGSQACNHLSLRSESSDKVIFGVLFQYTVVSLRRRLLVVTACSDLPESTKMFMIWLHLAELAIWIAEQGDQRVWTNYEDGERGCGGTKEQDGKNQQKFWANQFFPHRGEATL
jgi:hypothetical protein